MLGKSATSLVSVVIPAYNAASTLCETLSSVVTQTYPYLEVLVVDDGSQDDTCSIVREFAAKDPRVSLLHQHRSGVAGARNKGIAAARGAYIAPLDADDLWWPEKIEKQLQVFERATLSLGLVYTWTRVIDDGGTRLWDLTPDAEGDVLLPLVLLNFVGHGSGPLIRRDCLEEVGCYKTNFFAKDAQGCEDWDLYLRIARRFSFAVVRDFLVDYRVREQSMSQSFQKMSRSFMIMQANTFAAIPEVPRNAMRWGGSDFYRRQMRKALNAGQFGVALRFQFRSCALNPARLLQPGTYRTFVLICSKGKLGRRAEKHSAAGSKDISGEPPAARTRRKTLLSLFEDRMIRNAAESLKKAGRAG